MLSMALQWSVKSAPPQSDIIWENMYHCKNFKTYFFNIFINVSFFLLFSVVINPQFIA